MKIEDKIRDVLLWLRENNTDDPETNIEYDEEALTKLLLLIEQEKRELAELTAIEEHKKVGEWLKSANESCYVGYLVLPMELLDKLLRGEMPE